MTTTCFLCDARAEARASNYANRIFYSCFNQRCGDYEISSTAMQWMVSAATRLRASQEAFLARGKGGYFEITFSISTCEFEGRFVTWSSETKPGSDLVQ